MVRKSDVESIDERGGIGLYLHRVVPTQPYAQGALLLMAAFSTSKQSDRCGLIALDAAHSKHCTLCGGGVCVVVCVCVGGWVWLGALSSSRLSHPSIPLVSRMWVRGKPLKLSRGGSTGTASIMSCV